MSAFGAPGQLAARGASRRPDAVQAARRNLTKSVHRAEGDRDPSTRAHRALQHAPPNCLRAGPPRGRSRCTCACPSASDAGVGGRQRASHGACGAGRALGFLVTGLALSSASFAARRQLRCGDRKALRIRGVDSTGRNHAWIGHPSGRSGALAFAPDPGAPVGAGAVCVSARQLSAGLRF
jgi:hypothetical protein